MAMGSPRLSSATDAHHLPAMWGRTRPGQACATISVPASCAGDPIPARQAGAALWV